ncbi:hypothetical protein [uncultured Flavobacterium sp.]|uniref:hypothetical protein n=1 Tax=uncultured Flavobacterium sp. TaxID=165435 RepID=UPI0025E36D47|nr:hypothetical protein [uncultured Flavobacterium sp.]
MKKILGLIAALILMMGCDDGDMSFNTFDFSAGTPSLCAESNIYYKINGSEVLLIDLSGNPLLNVDTQGQPRIITIGGNNTITYRNYDGNPAATSICSFPAPASPVVLEEWQGEGTLSVITTVVRNSSSVVTGYSHKITLLDVSFTKNGETTRIADSEFGSVVIPIGFTFDFGTTDDELSLKSCDENNLVYKRKAREALLLNLDPARFAGYTAGQTNTLNIDDLTNEGVLFLVYNGSITDGHICDVIAPVAPTITERWEAGSGTIRINTVEVSGGGGALEHRIYFENMVFTKVSDTSGQTFTISDLIAPLPGETGYYFGVYQNQ